MERLKHIKDTLIGCLQAQMSDIRNADEKELSAAVDMIKDIEEAIYYHVITDAMKEKEKEGPVERHYYAPYYPPFERERDMDKEYYGRMYYPGQPRDAMGRFTERNYYDGQGGNGGSSGSGRSNGGSSSGGGNRGGSSSTRGYYEYEFPVEFRDEREGRSPMSRRMYMESKELHKDKTEKIKELEKYMKELGEDITEMIHDASSEEKQLLEKKLSALSSKIGSLTTTNG